MGDAKSSARALVGDGVTVWARAAVWRRAVWAASAADGDGEGDGCSARSNESEARDEGPGGADESKRNSNRPSRARFDQAKRNSHATRPRDEPLQSQSDCPRR